MKIKRIRKLKRKKKFNQNVNRKRLRDKMRKLPNIPCDQVKKAWEDTKSIHVNLKDMGLAYDANQAVQIPNVKQEMLENAKKILVESEDQSDHETEKTSVTASKNYVAEKLEAEAKAPRKRLLKLPKSQAEFLTYLIKQYGDDYKAMSRDKKNQYQLTWKQIRAKIKVFKGIPEQYKEYIQNSDAHLES